MIYQSKKKKKAYILVEVLLAIAILASITVFSVPLFQSFQTSNATEEATNLVTRAIRTAQLNAQGAKNDSTWGVRLQSGTIIVFKGSDYASRDTTLDIPYVLSTNLSVSGVSEIVFSKVEGLPSTTGTITLSTANATNSITINEKGILSY